MNISKKKKTENERSKRSWKKRLVIAMYKKEEWIKKYFS